MNNYRRSHWALEVEDVSPPGLLQAMVQENLSVFGAEPVGPLGLRFCVLQRDLGPLRALLEVRGTRVLSCTPRGPGVLLRRLKHRKLALVLGLVLGVLLSAGSLFVWRIDLSGNVRIPDSVLQAALTELGAGIGSFWPGYDGEGLQTALLMELPELQWVGLRYGGGVLQVQVREKRPVPEPEPQTPRDLRAAFDGVVTAVRPLRGRAMIAVGDTVERGQVLLSGMTESRNNAPRQVAALGTVEARVWHTFTALQAAQVQKKQYTGRDFHRLSLNFWGNRVKFYLGSSFSPPTCDKITLDYHLRMDGVFTLPLGLTVETYREYEPVVYTRPKTQQEALARGALLDTLTAAMDGGRLLHADYAARAKDGVLAVTVTGECLQNIAVPAPIQMETEEMNHTSD